MPEPEDSYDNTSYFQQEAENQTVDEEAAVPAEHAELQARESTRTVTPNPRYYNDEFVVNRVEKL